MALQRTPPLPLPLDDPEFCAWYEGQVEKLNAARKARDFAESDRIRAELMEAGFRVRYEPGGAIVLIAAKDRPAFYRRFSWEA